VRPHLQLCVEFCNEWPEVLSTDEICDELFPIEVITRDVVSDGASLRDPRARLVTLKVCTSYWSLSVTLNDLEC